MQKTMKKNKARKGFTLVELIVVIAILAVLAAAAIAGYAGVTQNARYSQAKSNAATICNAVNNHISIASTPNANITGATINASGTAAGAGTVVTAVTAAGTQTLDLSIAPGITAGTTGLDCKAPGSVKLDLKVSLTGPEWKDALALIEVSGTGATQVWVVGSATTLPN